MKTVLNRRGVLASAASVAVLLGTSKGALARNAADTITNGIGMEFRLIPAGSFLMGSPDSDREARDFEKPQHSVTISRPFYLARHEVTQAQWEAVMGSNPYTLDRSNPYYGLPGMAERITRPDHPATVSWNDAQRFIARLNGREGGNRYRLPTEAEWEYAARAGTTTAYSFGDNAAALGRYAWYGEDFATGGTHPVGRKAPNPWGLYDIHGNAWEWVRDWYDPAYYANSPATDPQGPEQGAERVVRGGSWHATATSWRTAFRRGYVPDYRGISIGFRLLRTAE
ncbi:formylglycine-generating enzyme family protein [Azospirillum sp. B506]|uniref:formylglycine-generating enzyme family protein n=1 Tax=Azospirillum sp. B506 TaxID=137721 RepID=UPI00034938D2|nr:formylglycine-generating enzyme family protein [Azospirillum sp. B506]